MSQDPNRETLPPMTGVANAEEDVTIGETPEDIEEVEDEDENEAPDGVGPV